MTHVSVIIPTWNRVVETGRAVLSVLNQTFQDFEVIIADDGSTDSTPAKFAHYPDPRVHYMQLEHSGLPAVARNAALHQAQGEYAAFLDSDDEWIPTKLERQLAFMQNNPLIGMVCTNARIRRENTSEPGPMFHAETIGSQEWSLTELVRTNIIITSSLLANKKSILAAGGFPADPMYRAIEDYALWLRLALNNRLYYMAEFLLFYTDSGASIRSLVKMEEYLKGLLRLFEELAINTKSEPPAVQQNIKIRIAGCLRDLRRIASANGKKNDVINHSLRLLKLEPGNIQNYGFFYESMIRAIKRKN